MGPIYTLSYSGLFAIILGFVLEVGGDFVQTEEPR